MTEYIGIPYKVGGRTREEGLDCYGLIRLVLNERYGKNLPALDEYRESGPGSGGVDAISAGRPLIDAKSVTDLQDGDIVAMRIRGVLAHLGVYVGGWVIHTLSGHNSVAERLDGIRMKGRIEGFYRV